MFITLALFIFHAMCLFGQNEIKIRIIFWEYLIIDPSNSASNKSSLCHLGALLTQMSNHEITFLVMLPKIYIKRNRIDYKLSKENKVISIVFTLRRYAKCTCTRFLFTKVYEKNYKVALRDNKNNNNYNDSCKNKLKT